MPKKSINYFAGEDVMVILTTSPAGLGHVRVTEALRGGLTDKVEAEVLGLHDPLIQVLHRLASRNRVLRGCMEFMQNNFIAEEYFTRWWIKRLRNREDEAYQKIKSLVQRRRPEPRVLFIVSTHHSLAHNIASIKYKLADDLKICVILAVVVTDDSPQKIWGVFDADYLFVPSSYTKDRLLLYMRRFSKKTPEVIVVPYPISKKFDKDLTEEEQESRQDQLSSSGKTKMQVIIPISGAAVQLKYFQDLILSLGYGERTDLTVVSRDSSYTKDFLAWCAKQTSVRVVASEDDKKVVSDYELEYEKNVLAIEVTKPSEQTFKVLTTPDERGGVLMFFSDPVGRQEADNLAFLKRYGLIPEKEEMLQLDRLVRNNLSFEEAGELVKRARHWRGMLLPTDGQKAGEFILKLRETGILEAMFKFRGFEDYPELHGDGVRKFWRKLEKRMERGYKLV